VKLYSYFRSSAAYRVRIALNLKRVAYEYVPVHLLRGEQRASSYTDINPEGLVPTLIDDEAHDTVAMSQSLAIIEYLEETHPEPPLLPHDAPSRARVRAIAGAIACDIHPLNNLRVLQYLKHVLGIGDEARDAWYRHWVARGLDALEARLAREPGTGAFCHGDAPTLADICLVPQLSNARRMNVPLEAYRTLVAIEANCLAQDAFARAAPENQPDAS